MADGNTVFTTACFRGRLSDEEREKLGRLLAGARPLSEEQCGVLRYFIDDVTSDLMIANDLVDLVDNVVGNLTMHDRDDRERAQACSALLGVQLQLQAVARRLDAIRDKLQRKAALS
jgi:hypothetical protein